MELEDTHIQVQAFLEAENILPRGNRTFNVSSLDHSELTAPRTMHSQHTPARSQGASGVSGLAFSSFAPLESMGKSLQPSHASFLGAEDEPAGHMDSGGECLRRCELLSVVWV